MGEFIERLEKSTGLNSDQLFLRIINKERDLEFLLAELEEWIGKGYFYPGPEFFEPIGQIQPTAFETELFGLVRRAHELHQTVRHEVFTTYRSILSARALETLQLPLFESAFHALQPVKKPLVIFTTNYDPAVENLCEGNADGYDLIDGFVHQPAGKSYVWSRKEFDDYRGPNSKKNVVLFKLHGSTGWTKTPSGIIRSAASIYTTDDSSHQNVLIYPARRKVATEEPFFTAYDYFQRCMENCRLCITIGYSFRDEDALTRLRSASSINPHLRVLVLDPNSAEICSTKLVPLGIRAEPIGRSFQDFAGDPNLRTLIRDDIATAVSESIAE